MLDRYSRQVLYEAIGESGQRRIRDLKVFVAGCGALGSVSSEILVRGGVGSLTLIDRDFVEASNLQRQSLFTERDAAECLPKAVAAERALSAINSEVEVRGIVDDLTCDNIEERVSDCDVIVDGTDNFETRYLINDYSVSSGRPWAYGACVGSFGTALLIRPGETPCLRCLFEDPPEPGSQPTCDTSGILASTVHAVAALQVAQVIQWAAGAVPGDRIHQFDVWHGQFRSLCLSESRRPECPCCGSGQFEFLRGERRDRSQTLCGRNAVQLMPAHAIHIDLGAVSQRLERIGRVSANEHLIRFSIGDYEIALFPNGRSIVRGTHDPAVARAVYTRYIGN